jgi:hypothetical protein
MPADPNRRADMSQSRQAADGNGPREIADPAARNAKPLLPTINTMGSAPVVLEDVSTASRPPGFAEPAAIGEAGQTDVAVGSPAADGWVAATHSTPLLDARREKTGNPPALRDVPEDGECTRHMFTIPPSETTGADDSETGADGRKGWGAHRCEETHPDRLAGSDVAQSRPDRAYANFPNASPPTQPWRLAHVDPTPHVPKRSGKPHPLWERLGGPAVPRAARRDDSPRRLPSLAEEPLVLTRRTSADGSERRANRFDSPRIVSPYPVVKLRMEIAPIAGVPQIQSPRRLTFEMRSASPKIRSPRRFASESTSARAEISSPRRTSFGLRNASPEIRSPRKTTVDSRIVSPRTRSRQATLETRDAAPQAMSPREMSFALRDASPEIRSPQKATFIQTVSNEPTPADLTPSNEAADDDAAAENPPAETEDETQTPNQPAAELKEDQKLGEAPEDTSLRFLRQQTVLLEPGEHELDISIQYLNDKIDFVALQQQNGGVQVAEAERRNRLLLVPLQLRYGISKYTQAFVNVPFGWSNSEASFLGIDRAADSGGIGDVGGGLVKQIIVGNEYYPDVLATLSFSAPTGESDFLTALDTPGSNLGEGFWSTSAALTFIQTYDPLVFFYGAGFRYRFEEKFGGAVKVKPGPQAFYSLGVGFAVTPHVTLSAAFTGSFISEFEVNGEDVGGSAQEPMQVRLAATINKRRPPETESCLKVIEPFVAFGVNDDAIDTVLGITWTY